MKRFKVVITLVIAIALVTGISLFGCKKKEAAEPSSASPHAMPSAGPAGDGISGKIVETMNSGGYTYINVESGGKKTWLAMPETKMKVGQQVRCEPGMEMPNFHSKTLNRTFPVVVFTGGCR